jgi:uncharacterized protein YeaO (DUF488 family)
MIINLKIKSMEIVLKRVYEDASPEDGYRVLVDRIWPRGISKEKAALDEWDKDLAPSTELREWFHHDPLLWDEFSRNIKKSFWSKIPENLSWKKWATGKNHAGLCSKG